MTSQQVDPVLLRAQQRVGAVLRQKWRLDGLLGVGGMAAVYVATHRNGKRGAVKMLHLELSSDPEAKKRFLREGYAANAVDHPGAVAVLDDDVAEDGSVFLVMELLEGHTLDARAESRPGSKLEVGEVLAVTDQLLDILVAAHAKGIVHRDLKPENVFLTKTGQVKVLDFGLASLRTASKDSVRMTTAGSAMGTPAFMPPEQALGNWDTVDARTDLWAVGATMFNLLTGRFVHEADNVNKLLLAAMTKPSRKIATVEPSIPPSVAAIVDRALAFDQKDRWPDAGAMRAAVRFARSGGGKDFATLAEPPAVGSTQLSVGPVQRNALASSLGPTSSEPRLALGKMGFVAGAVLAVAAGVGVLFMLRGHSPPPPATAAQPEARTEAPAAASPPSVAPAPSASASVAPPAVEPPAVEPAPPPTSAPTAATSAPVTMGAASHGPHPKPSAAPKATAAPKVDPLKNW